MSESAPHLVSAAATPRGDRPEQPEPFLRGARWPGTRRVPYPRADPTDRRLPADTWQMASLPVGVRLELAGDATQVEIAYVTATDQLGYRGDGAGTTFAAGADIAELRERDRVDALRGVNSKIFDRVHRLPMPTVALIDGYALGGGAELAYACDFRIGTPRTRIGAGRILRLIRISRPEYRNIMKPPTTAEITSSTMGWVNPASRTTIPIATRPHTSPA